MLPDCPPPYFAIGHSMGGTRDDAPRPPGQRWFDRIVLSAPMIRLSGAFRAREAGGQGDAAHRHGLGLCAGRQATVSRAVPLSAICDLRSGAARPHQAVLEAARLGLGSPTVSWLDGCLPMPWGEFAEPRYPGRLRQPILMIAAGRDQTVSTAAIEDFAMRLRAGSHLIVAGARHELMMEPDRYRAQFWAAFDAFVPGTPLFA